MAHYLVTGHTGFKGAWLIALLSSRGHTVSGLSLAPEHPSLFNRAQLWELLRHDIRADVRDKTQVKSAFSVVKPDFVIHLAAQSLVTKSYDHPFETYETNVAGTLNVLEASEVTDSVKAYVIATSDKVYKNLERKILFTEDQPLGGKDPYSNSKAMADLLAQQWLTMPGAKPGAIVRAGNVIGLGDYAPDRLLPDLISSISMKEPLQLRFPHAVRPWQHVLDCLQGYLMALNKVASHSSSGVWNFGPLAPENVTVQDLIDLSEAVLGIEIAVEHTQLTGVIEAGFLGLDCNRAAEELAWKPLLSLRETLQWTLFESSPRNDKELKAEMQRQIANFESQGALAGFMG